MIIKEVELTEEENQEIQDLNLELVTLKDLTKSSIGEPAYEKFFSKLKAAQLKYDNWFSKLQAKHNIETTTENRWNVDFIKKVLQLLG